MKKHCEQCGIEFTPKSQKARFCSANCRVANNRGTIKDAGDSASGSSSKKASLVGNQDQPLGQQPVADEPYDYEANLAAFRKMGLEQVTWITTGIPEFDALTQIPRGRVTQIQGPYAVGKTTLCLNMIRGLKGVKVLYIDTEAALNPELLANLQISSKSFTLYNESAFIEDIYEVIIKAVEKPQYDMIILDSLAACTFRTEAAGNATDSNIGQKAKVVNKLMRIIPMELKRTKTALVIINQEREVIGSYAPIKYTPGGMGVPYSASLMISLKSNKGDRFPKSGPPYKGQEVTAEIIKSKVNEPWRKASFKLYYGGMGA